MDAYKEVDRKRRKGVDGMKVVGRRELIETYWNVNLLYCFVNSVHPRINRDILECKSTNRFNVSSVANRINRNTMEYNLHKLST